MKLLPRDVHLTPRGTYFLHMFLAAFSGALIALILFGLPR